MKKRLAEQAMLVQNKGLQRMLDMDPGELTRREALDYFAKGVEIEGKNREVPDLKIEHSGQITHTNEIDLFVADDSKIRDKINELIKDIAEHPGRVRIHGKQQEMDPG